MALLRDFFEVGIECFMGFLDKFYTLGNRWFL